MFARTNYLLFDKTHNYKLNTLSLWNMKDSLRLLHIKQNIKTQRNSIHTYSQPNKNFNIGRPDGQWRIYINMCIDDLKIIKDWRKISHSKSCGTFYNTARACNLIVIVANENPKL